jgi:hypothetical protein
VGGLALFFFFFLVELGFKLRALCLQKKHSTACATPPVDFALVILEMSLVNYLPGLASNYNPSDFSLPNS